MSTIDIEKLEDLESGSVWHRKDGSEATVLFISNQKVPLEVQKQFPPQVVYVTEEGEVRTVPVAVFLKSRVFHNINPELLERLDNLFQFDDSQAGDNLLIDDSESSEEEIVGLSVSDDYDTEEEDSEVSMSLSLDDMEPESTVDDDSESFDDSLSSDRAELGMTDSDDLSTNDSFDSYLEDTEEANGEFDEQEDDSVDYATLSFIPINPELPTAIHPTNLSRFVSAYTQEPLISESKMVHKITFKSDASYGIEDLRKCFYESTDSSIVVFSVITDEGEEIVDWDNIAGVYRQVYAGIVYYQVVLLVNVNVSVTQFVVPEPSEYMLPTDQPQLQIDTIISTDPVVTNVATADTDPIVINPAETQAVDSTGNIFAN